MCSGEGIPSILAHPGGMWLPEGLCSPPEGEGAASCFGLVEVHMGFLPVFIPWTSASVHLPIPPALVPVAVPTRGCAREAAPLLPLPHPELIQNPVGCAAVPSLTQLTSMEWGSSCLGSPAWHCYPLTFVIFPNLYIYMFCKFSRKLRSNLFPPVIPLHPPVSFIFFFSSHILHYVKHRWRNMSSKSALPLCLQQLGLDLAAYLIKGGSCTFYSFL